jgi:hypothetical protein
MQTSSIRTIKSFHPIISFKIALVLLALIFLTACSSKDERLKGWWFEVNTLEPQTLLFDGDKMIFDNRKERRFSANAEKGELKTEWLSLSETFNYKCYNDTLILTTPDKRFTFVKEAKLGKAEVRLSQLVQVEAQKAYNEDPNRFKKKDKKDKQKEVPRKTVVVRSVALKPYAYKEVKNKFHLPISAANAKSFDNIPDEETVFMGSIVFEEGAPGELFVRAGRDNEGWLKPIWVETVESTFKRYVAERLFTTPKEVVIEKAEQGRYEGKIIFEEDDQMAFQADLQQGLIPKNTVADMEVYGKYFLRGWFGNGIEKLTLKEEGKTAVYKGTVFTKSEKAFPVTLSVMDGWRVPTDMETAKIAIPMMLSSQLKSVVEVKNIKFTSEGEFEVLANQSKVGDFVVYTDLNLLWYPKKDPENIKKSLILRINPLLNKSEVTNVELSQVEEGIYKAVLTFDKDEKKQETLKVYHLNKLFTWELWQETTTAAK